MQGLQKKTVFRSRKYLDWVKSLPSAISGAPADDPHHIHGHNQGGVGKTASDMFAFPLTRNEHTDLHQVGWKQWELRWGSQWEYVARTLKLAIDEGVLSYDLVENEIDMLVINSDTRAFFRERFKFKY